MNEEKFKDLIKEALAEFIETERGEALLGNIVLNAIRQHFYNYEMAMEKVHPDGGIEKYIHKGDPLALICKWVKNAEGAIRGCQSDAAQARNKAVQVRNMIAQAVAKSEERRQINAS